MMSRPQSDTEDSWRSDCSKMPEADVTYANYASPPPDDTTYSEIMTLQSELPVCANCSQNQAGSNRKGHVTSERAALLVLSLLLLAAVIAVGVTGSQNKVLEERMDHEVKVLKDENEALRKNVSAYKSEREMQTRPQMPTCPPPPTCPRPPTCPLPSTCPPPPTCPRPPTCPPPPTPPPSGPNTDGKRVTCEAGWEPHGGKCYYFTTTKSSWKESRAGCEGKGGDLVKIDSREEQIFLEARLRDKMSKDWDIFWVGLTDSEEEGRWMWVDGSPLDTRLMFWRNGEPNDSKTDNPAGEDCVRMRKRREDKSLNCWDDHSCDVRYKSICEKPATDRRY